MVTEGAGGPLFIFQGQQESPRCVPQELGSRVGVQGSPLQVLEHELPAEAGSLGWGTVLGGGEGKGQRVLPDQMRT